jgi:twitching motility protein PilT
LELNELLKEVVGRSASDLHLVPGSPPMLRINGFLIPSQAGAKGSAILGRDDVRGLFEPFLTARQQAMLDQKQDIHTSIEADDSFMSERPGEAIRFRICLFWEREGLGAALRSIPVKIPTLSHLFTPETEATFRALIGLKRGLILVVGLTGSGKSTSIASMIDAINTEQCERIFTIEDPIEYVHTSKSSLISQREVGTDVESFEQGGLSAFRSDPDVILVGELRTQEAVRIAVALAETGHLVFATVHANTVSEAVRRMVEAFPETRETMQRMIARSLSAVIAQSLVPRATATGRVPILEIMLVNTRIRRLIEDGETDLSLAIEAGRAEGMRTMDDSVLQFYHNGTITYETAWNRIQNRDRLGGIQKGAAETTPAPI